MIYLVAYLFFGIGMYTFAAINHPKSYKDASPFSIFMGILGCLFWPITIFLLRNKDTK